MGGLVTVAVLLAAYAPAAPAAPSDARERILTLIRSHPSVLPRRERLCVRFPVNGPAAIVFVRDRHAVVRAKRFLRFARVAGAIEVENARQYAAGVERIVEVVRAGIPPALRAHIHVDLAHTVGELQCFRAMIQLNSEDEVTAAESAWAAEQIKRFGSDLVYITHIESIRPE
jgi:hypothetical protein